MQTIRLTCGTSIDEAASLLVRSAPASADFNGIRIRARYATTRPADLVTHYHHALTMQSIAWRHSPDGKSHAAESEARRQSAQRVIDTGLDALQDIDFTNLGAVLGWVEAMAPAVDRVGVEIDKPALVAKFATYGWIVGVNCGENFNGYDARNYAGWIVGQWLDSWHPIVASKFIPLWRAQHDPAAS